MSTSPDPSVARRDDPETLLEVLCSFTESVVVGFEPTDEHLDCHVAPIPPDDRAAAAGLFGIVAPPEWSAVGAAFSGTARDLRTREPVGDGASAAVLLTREGHLAWRMRVEGTEDARLADGVGHDGPGTPTGLVIDALHRVLGLRCPGTPVTSTQLALGIWSHHLLDLILRQESLTWDDAVAVHPGDPGGGPIGPSDEMLVEALIRLGQGFHWDHMHRRAAAGTRPAAELCASEAAWMDTTLFSRWVLSAMPDPLAVVEMLRLGGHDGVARRFARVARAVERLSSGAVDG